MLTLLPPQHTMSDIIYPAAAPQPKSLPQTLCDLLIYQKTLSLERAGVPAERIPKLSEEKAWQIFGPQMTKMSLIIEDWGADPAVVMEACFAYARSKKHMNGPQAAMLASKKYLLQAIAYHLEIPNEAARDMVSKEAMLKRLEKEAMGHEAAIRNFLMSRYGNDSRNLLLDKEAATAVAMLNAIPPLYRFLYNVLSRPLAIALIPEVLTDIRDNAQQLLWAKHMGWSYRAMAYYYHTLAPVSEK